MSIFQYFSDLNHSLKLRKYTQSTKYNKNYDYKVNVKSSLKDSIAVLNSVGLDQIDMVLNNFREESTSPPIESKCEICGFISKNLKGLASPQRKCNTTKSDNKSSSE